MSEHDEGQEHCGEIGHQALATIVWYCPHRQSFQARWTLHDDLGVVHSEQVTAFGPFDSRQDVERWIVTQIRLQLRVLTTRERWRDQSATPSSSAP